MKKISLSLLTAILISIAAPSLTSIRFEKKYTYDHEAISLMPQFQDLYARESSLNSLASQKIGKIAYGKAVFQKPKNMFTLRIDKTDTSTLPEVLLTIHGERFRAEIDMDGDERMLEDSYYYTKPIFTEDVSTLAYSVSTPQGKNMPKTLELIGLDTSDATESLTISPESDRANADDTLITRKQWGADETLRYEDHPTWKKYYAKQAADTTPKSDATIAYEKKIADIRNLLASAFPEKEVPIETITKENGHTLVWPIEKTRTVDRIVVHHSAEENRTEKDDLTLLRGIYYYHTIVRGWGDIGYNYIVGQQGQLYEGRAGGDYAAAAHALWNNKSSVGITVLGNFETYNINRTQEDGLKNALQYVSKKYGIDLQKTSIAHRECPRNSTQPCSLLENFQTYNLSGHREVGYTTCPGTNLYTELASIREGALYSAGLTPIINPDSTTPIQTNTTLNAGPTIKIKLSYPTNSIRIKSLSPTEPMVISLGTLSRPLKTGLELRFEPYGSDQILLWLGKKKMRLPEISLTSTVLEVPGWDRTPTWDKNKTYNDNKFRGTLHIMNDGGKLLVVNELPLENYLKGLAEISNTDNTEKIKTILVAARSYAHWYVDPANRKFPGKSYDGSDDPDVFQKYLGYGYEQRSGNIGRLVDETNGTIIQYQGKDIKPWYFNQSNGKTLSAKEYCEKNTKTTSCPDIPYLQSVLDPAGNLGQKGHGVGISGAGATFLATQMDFTYDRIIKYFLDGVELKKIY